MVTCRIIQNNRGAVAVEFGFALLLLMFFFVFFMALAQIFIGHQRMAFASFAAGRVLAVHDEGPATATANAIEDDVAIEFSENSITLRKTIEIPFDFLDMYKRGMSGYEIENKTLSWREEDWGGDNG
jgi:Flp pilus assembly protein TadG